jgi:hypothetical protein
MATVKGVNKTKIDAGTPENILYPGDYDGRVKVMTDTYEAVAAAVGTVILMCGKLPKYARVLTVLLSCDALGAATFNIGDEEDVDRYFSAQTVAAALINQAGDEVDGVNYQVDETDADNLDSQIQIVTAGAAITGTVKLTVIYAHD